MYLLKKTEVLIEGLTFTEGPRWHDGRLYFSDFFTHRVLAVDTKGNMETIVETPQQPSGLGWSPDGAMLIVSMNDQKLLSFSNGELSEVADLSQLATHYCNDMVVDKKGNASVGNFGFDLHAGEPIKPNNIPIHCFLETSSFKIGPAKALVKIGCRVTIKAVIPVGIPFDIAKKTPPK